MTPFDNKLSAAEAERLAILAEEAGEIVQAVGKILRHGYESYNPDIANHPINRATLAREIGDFDAICGLMVEAGDLDPERIKSSSTMKRQKLAKWTHHQ